MLKRITNRVVNARDDEELRESTGYRPDDAEIQMPDATPRELKKIKRMLEAEGDYHCTLCPKKVLMTERDMKLHLISNSHRKRLVKHYQKNKSVLMERLAKMKR